MMYNSAQSLAKSWPGEPETDPAVEAEEADTVTGSEIDPRDCMDLAHNSVLADPAVEGGEGLYLCPPFTPS